MTTLSLADFQAEFAGAISAGDPEARPTCLAGEAADRFRIYRNNVFHGLGEALGDAYPVVRRLVGDAFFRAMAVEYVVRHPPKTRSLALFGAEFPVFVGRFPPAASVPYLADVARLERAELEARHAEDAEPLAPHSVAALGAAVVEARLVVHPAARLIDSGYPIAAIWHANQPEADGRPGHPLRMARGSALVTRPHLRTAVQPLAAAETTFANALFHGETIATALADSTIIDPGFDTGVAFRILLAAGAFRAIRPADAPPPSDSR